MIATGQKPGCSYCCESLTRLRVCHREYCFSTCFLSFSMFQKPFDIKGFLEPLFQNTVFCGQLKTKKVVLTKNAPEPRVICKIHTVCNPTIFMKSQDVFRCDRGLDSITLIISIIIVIIAVILAIIHVITVIITSIITIILLSTPSF